MDAGLCAAISACPVAGAACCPEAGPAAAANVASNSKFRRAFMSTIRRWLQVCPVLVPVRRDRYLIPNVETTHDRPWTGGHWRLFRTLHIYVEARSTPDILDRLHQYARCIDGLILPDAGQTKRQFKSRSELFIGPRHHELMGEIYDVRSAVEHLHENRYLEGKKEAQVEYAARTALARIIADPKLWDHFANTPALAAFWSLPAPDRQRMWGAPANVLDAIADFDPQYIHNGLLGA
jgi:hypothetical protein